MARLGGMLRLHAAKGRPDRTGPRGALMHHHPAAALVRRCAVKDHLRDGTAPPLPQLAGRRHTRGPVHPAPSACWNREAIGAAGRHDVMNRASLCTAARAPRPTLPCC